MTVDVEEGRRCQRCGSKDVKDDGPQWMGHAGEKFVPWFRQCTKCGWRGKIWLENTGS